ncbi:oxygen-independent coproporphyrinogen III oxidase [Salicola sp. Rm-C-2C1-2]|uniref:oxygen-independent coproporphyrinogen III oxidase n=1 Tax=Salicola sp. Rm-C-2C1-2 TaxID=3141321 RepID=UPI0032E3FF1A
MTSERINLLWDPELIERYDLAGPRYTSYPTALAFSEDFNGEAYRQTLERSRASGAPLSLYLHIPFCAHLCYYCACNKIVTRKRDRAGPYLERLHKEIAMRSEQFGGQERPATQLHWGGGTPTFISHDEMRELMRVLHQHFRLADDDSGDHSIEIDPRECGPETLEVLRSIGFNRISLGVQDFNPNVQKAVNRIQPYDTVANRINVARDLGFGSINMDLIYGLPHQNRETFRETLEQVLALEPDRLSVFNYAHLPDRFMPQQRILEEDLPSPEEKLGILEDTINRLLEASYVYIGMDHFAKPDDTLAIAQHNGDMHRNFQGYTTHGECDLIGMGVSAISQAADSYFQNHHDEGVWNLELDFDRTPLKKGYQLSDDDRMRRAVIMELICHFSLDKQAFAATWGAPFDQVFADTLPARQTMQDDGLIEDNAERLAVRTPGRLLIRAICQLFDAHAQKTQAGRYSRII